MNGPSFVLQTKILPSHGNSVKTEIGTLATAGIELLATHLFAISTKNTDFVAVVILFILNWVLVLFLHAPSLSVAVPCHQALRSPSELVVRLCTLCRYIHYYIAISVKYI